MSILDINYAAKKAADTATGKAMNFAALNTSATTAKGNIAVNYVLGLISDETDTPLAFSALGTPVVNALQFKGGKYLLYNLKGELTTKSIKDFLLPATSVIDFTRKKTITKTPTLGGQGTVKEIYAIEEWDITISGTCLSDSCRTEHQSAYEQQLALEEFNRVAGNISVAGGKLFLDKDIHAITIENVTFKAKKGSPDEIDFTITATSDNPIELTF
ncbi:MAG: DUF6046 domain-containing protein [Paludibacteraceae bacterium]|nr:DUF6046 domain-containing protein [Paludibacteraceae bacterium]